jgi:hypothetical protein
MGNNLKKKLAAERHNMELERRKDEERLRKEQHEAWAGERKAMRAVTSARAAGGSRVAKSVILGLIATSMAISS